MAEYRSPDEDLVRALVRIRELEEQIDRSLSQSEQLLAINDELRSKATRAIEMGEALLAEANEQREKTSNLKTIVRLFRDFLEKHEEFRSSEEVGLRVWGVTEADRADMLHRLDRILR